MAATMTNEHPSNQLHNGDVHDFETAVRVYLDAVLYELRQGDASLEEAGFWNRECLGAMQAQELYRAAMKDAEVDAIARLRLAELDIWADALETGDYKELAI